MSERKQVDNFTLDCYRNCPKMYYWRIKRQLIKVGERRTPIDFGVAVHLGLETFYKEGMTQTAKDNAFTKALEYFTPLESEGDKKRTAANLVSILDKYFSRYANEPFEVIATEVGGAFELNDEWIYTSRLDLLVEWKAPKGMYIVDHKTTYDIGSLIAKPHNQVTGYIVTLHEMYDNVLGAMINGIGVYESDTVQDKNAPKVVSEKTGKLIYATKEREIFNRIPTQRTVRECEEWKREVVFLLKQIDHCEEVGVWPKHSPDHCVKFKGRCGYLDLCNTDEETCERMIDGGVYIQDPWKAYHETGDVET